MALGSTLHKKCDVWWEGYSLTLTGGAVIENYPVGPVGDRLVRELQKWGDRYPFSGQIKGRFTLVATAHYRP